VRYLSVCSGIEAASVAWHPLGWEPAAFCEIEAFPSAVLAHRYPNVPNYGDFTRLTDAAHPIHGAGVDLLVGGTPCQAFSVAGLRQGLADARGGLALEYVRLARALSPRWILWENVPGVLSSGQGRDFGAFVGALVESGYGVAWRVLDAQHVRVDGYPHAVPQRRKRVFLVGHSGGDAARAAAVLFEPEGVRRDSAPRRETRKGAASDAAGGFEVCGTLSDGAHHGGGLNGQDAYTGRVLPVAFDARQTDVCVYGDKTGPLDTDGSSIGVLQPIAFSSKDSGNDATMNVSPTLRSGGHTTSHANAGVMPAVALGMSVRRLTPTECERLQGFPDGWTQIPWKGKSASECPDGPRYKALGNSMACNVMRWIGTRIAMVDAAGGEA
jgi:DNA (cytosine-5)-methyltransferase 1